MPDNNKINEFYIPIDNSPPADIVEIADMLGEFSASEGQRVEDYIEKIEKLGEEYKLKSGEKIGTVILALRGEPHKWAINKLEQNMRIEWDQFKADFKYKFATRNFFSQTIFVLKKWLGR